MKNLPKRLEFFLPKRLCRNVLFPYVPILLSEVEQEQRPSGNGDREAIVVGIRSKN